MSIIDKARKLRKTIESLALNLDDESAVKNVELFEAWHPDTDYAVDDRRRFGSYLYKCLQAHTSQATWTPDAAPSLWARVLIPDPHDIPEWEQPSSTNPYMKGDKVRHLGKIWVSDVDSNVWEPGVPGTETLWHEVEA